MPTLHHNDMDTTPGALIVAHTGYLRGYDDGARDYYDRDLTHLPAQDLHAYLIGVADGENGAPREHFVTKVLRRTR
jgi:hypothetical protein